MKHYDLFVIGGGSGGVAAARASANLGAKVAIAEGDKFGGTCVNRGCMPKKFDMYASMCAQEFETAKSYGWMSVSPRLIGMHSKRTPFNEIKRLNGIYDTMLGNAKSDKVVGAHVVGPDVGEIIQMMGVALRAGATKHEFDRTVGVHPTISEEFVTMREITRMGCKDT